jgi:hypothetical protein
MKKLKFQEMYIMFRKSIYSNSAKAKTKFIKTAILSLSLAIGFTSAIAQDIFTLNYNGVTYDNVGVFDPTNSTYEEFYSIASIQPWYQSDSTVCGFLNSNCSSLKTLFDSSFPRIASPSLYAAIVGTLNPSDPDASTTPNYAIVRYDNDTLILDGTGSFYNQWFGILYLVNIGPSPEDTIASMQPNASAMKNAFNSQYATLAYGLNHDCTIYDSNGVCVSVFGRNTSLNDSSFDSNAGGLILGYKPHAQFRIGTYIDQSLNSNTTGGVKVERSNPDIGVFGVWNMNADGSGLELRAAANYGKRDLNITRSTVGNFAEAGSGRSDLNAYGALFEASYAYAMNDSWTAKPYAGVRYLSIKRDGYTEHSTDDVYNPLSFSNLKQETTSALVGVRFNGRIAPKLMASLNAGLEHDLHYSIDDYRATGVNGLGSIDMNSQKDRTRPTAGLGISYDVAEKQRLSATVQYRKEIFMSESSTTGQINYTIGF